MLFSRQFESSWTHPMISDWGFPIAANYLYSLRMQIWNYLLETHKRSVRRNSLLIFVSLLFLRPTCCCSDFLPYWKQLLWNFKKKLFNYGVVVLGILYVVGTCVISCVSTHAPVLLVVYVHPKLGIAVSSSWKCVMQHVNLSRSERHSFVSDKYCVLFRREQKIFCNRSPGLPFGFKQKIPHVIIFL